MKYAIDELWDCINKLKFPVGPRDPHAMYVSALLSELTYLYVPQQEIDDKKRAIVVPCDDYQAIVRLGAATTPLGYLRGEGDFANAFVIESRGAIAVGIAAKGLLFIAFRGTQFLYDWRINLTARLTNFWSHPLFFGGRVHWGFAEEAVRISHRISNHIRDTLPKKLIGYFFVATHWEAP